MPEPVRPSPGQVLPPRAHVPDEVDLFRYSAAVGLAHRIHYDAGFARAEGLPGPVVHGPLQGAYLLRLVEEWLAPLGGRVIEIGYRHRRSACAGDRLEARGRVAAVEATAEGLRVDVEVELVRVADGGEEIATSGSIEAVVPERRTR